MRASLIIPRLDYEQMVEAAQRSPNEICGLLAGRGDTVHATLALKNQEQSPIRYRIDADEQGRTLKELWGRGLEWIGIYHSHRSGPASLSGEDELGCRIEGVWQLVIGLEEDRPPQIGVFRFSGGAYKEGSLKVVET